MHPHSHLPEFWATTAPSAMGIALVALIAVIGIALVLFFLRSTEPVEKPAVDDAERALHAIAKARAQILDELERAEGPLRDALTSMIGPPLRELDGRLAGLVATARVAAPPSTPTDAERARVRALL